MHQIRAPALILRNFASQRTPGGRSSRTASDIIPDPTEKCRLHIETEGNPARRVVAALLVRFGARARRRPRPRIAADAAHRNATRACTYRPRGRAVRLSAMTRDLFGMESGPDPGANRRFRLSKSRLVAYRQCPKRLWLQTFRRELAQQSEASANRMAQGNLIGAAAHRLFPGGRLIAHVDDLPAALRATQEALAQPGDVTLFEPALRCSDILVRADVLVREGGRYRMIEVKASTKVKDYHVDRHRDPDVGRARRRARRDARRARARRQPVRVPGRRRLPRPLRVRRPDRRRRAAAGADPAVDRRRAARSRRTHAGHRRRAAVQRSVRVRVPRVLRAGDRRSIRSTCCPTAAGSRASCAAKDSQTCATCRPTA